VTLAVQGLLSVFAGVAGFKKLPTNN